MRKKLLDFAILGIVAIIVAGCGGSGSTAGGGVPLTRATLITALKGASDTGTEVGTSLNGARRPSSPEIARTGSSADGPKNSDDPGTNPGSDREPPFIYVEGQIYEISENFFSKCIRAIYDGELLPENISLLEIENFKEREAINKIGSQLYEITNAGPVRSVRNRYTNSPTPENTSTSIFLTTINNETGVFLLDNSTEGSYFDTEANKFTTFSSRNVFETTLSKESCTFTFSYTINDFTRESTGVFNLDGSFLLTSTNSNGYTVTWRRDADSTGTFDVVNSADPLCPATGVFDSEGIGTITFADNTTSPINIFDSQFGFN